MTEREPENSRESETAAESARANDQPHISADHDSSDLDPFEIDTDADAQTARPHVEPATDEEENNATHEDAGPSTETCIANNPEETNSKQSADNRDIDRQRLELDAAMSEWEELMQLLNGNSQRGNPEERIASTNEPEHNQESGSRNDGTNAQNAIYISSNASDHAVSPALVPNMPVKTDETPSTTNEWPKVGMANM